MLLNIFDRLNLGEEKNILLQGIPSTLEKYFTKLSFAKNVTPLLKTRKIDFALVFAVNYNQLNSILKDVIPALRKKGKLWIAFPKPTSKIVSDLNRDCSFECLISSGFSKIDEVVIDHVWVAMRFCTETQNASCNEIELESLDENATVKDLGKSISRKIRTAVS